MYKTPHEFLLARIKELEGGAPDRDGFDDTFIQAYRYFAKEYECFGGWGDGGIQENYNHGLRSAMDDLQKYFEEYNRSEKTEINN